MTPQDKQAYNTLFSHFAARLAERYNLFITFDTYVSLCKSCVMHRPHKSFEGGRHVSNIGFIRIQKQYVLVCQSTMGRQPLITALPPNRRNKKQIAELQKQHTMNKGFMVVSYPKNGDRQQIDQLTPLHTEYDDAFQKFNGHIALETRQEISQPKGEKPLRFALKEEIVELWVINRTTELITN